jgi:hypothetical protein
MRPATQYGDVATTAWAQSVNDSFQRHWTDRPNVRVYRSAQLVTAPSVNVVVPFSAERWDTGNCWTSGANTKLIAPRSGMYFCYLNVGFAANTTGIRQALIIRDGSTTISLASSAVSPDQETGHATVSASGIGYLSEGSYVEANTLQTSGGNLNLLASAASDTRYQCEFGFVWMGEGSSVL